MKTVALVCSRSWRRIEERPDNEQSSEVPADDFAALVRDLIDDDVRWNATRAEHRLRLAGPVAAPWLEAVLVSRDRQQRELAARVSWSFPDHYHPETARAAVSALESSSDSSAVVAALTWLANHTDTVRPYLAAALGSPRGTCTGSRRSTAIRSWSTSCFAGPFRCGATDIDNGYGTGYLAWLTADPITLTPTPEKP